MYAKEIGGTRVMDKSHGWQAWKTYSRSKAAVETSGYKTRKDVRWRNPGAGSMQMKNSLAHPQGDKIIRKRTTPASSTATSAGSRMEIRGQAAYPQRGYRQEHAAASQPFDHAGVITTATNSAGATRTAESTTAEGG